MSNNNFKTIKAFDDIKRICSLLSGSFINTEFKVLINADNIFFLCKVFRVAGHIQSVKTSKPCVQSCMDCLIVVTFLAAS